MTIKLDENLPVTLAARLRSLGHQADTVRDEGLCGRDDETVWQAAQREGRFLVTQDLDFSDVRRFSPGTHFGILLVRMQIPGVDGAGGPGGGLVRERRYRLLDRMFGDRKLRIRSNPE